MDKIFFLLEITSSSPLRKVNNEVLDEVLQEADHICTDFDGSLLRHSRDLYFYGFPDFPGYLDSFLDRLADLYLVLKEKSAELQGFSLFLERVPREREDQAFTLCRDSLYRTAEHEDFYLGMNLAGMTSWGSSGARDTETGRRISITSGPPVAARTPGSKMLHRNTLVNRILEIIIPEIEEERESRFVHIFGPPGTGKSYNLSKALEILSKDLKEVPWTMIIPEYPDEDPVVPFFRGISPDFLKTVPSFLSPVEMKIWEETLGSITLGQGDNRGIDFLLMYRLYLTAYERRMDDLSLPALVICPQFQALPAVSRNLLASVCRVLPRDGMEIIPVVLSDSRDLEEDFGDLARINLKVTSMSAAGVDKRLDSLRETGVRTPPGDIYDGDLTTVVLGLQVLRQGTLPSGEITRDEMIKTLIKTLSPVGRRAFLGILLLQGVPGISPESLSAAEEIEPLVTVTGREECVSTGLLDENSQPLFSFFEHLPFLCGLIGENDGAFLRALSDALAASASTALSHMAPTVLGFICRYGSFVTALNAAVRYIDGCISAGNYDTAGVLLKEYGILFDKRKTPEDAFLLDLTLSALSLRLAVRTGDRDGSNRSIRDIDEIDELRQKRAAARYRLEYARYLYQMREFRSSLSSAKRALFLLESENESTQAGMVNLEIGLAMMSLGKIDEAGDYFSLTADLLREHDRADIKGYGLLLSAMSAFLIGSLDSSLTFVSEAGRIFAEFGERRRELYAVFFRGRILLRLGMYRESSAEFARALTLVRIYGIEDAKKTVYAWLARSEAYLGHIQSAVRILEGLEEDGETALFLAEARFLGYDPDQGKGVLEGFIPAEMKDDSILSPGEEINFRNGFSNLEDRVLNIPDRGGVLSHLIRGFRSYLLGLSGRRTEAYAELIQLTRDDKLGESDPNNMLYYYFAAGILPTGEEDDEINRLTLLSKALKYLQATASKISDPKMKQSYLWNNCWNAKLMAEGRERKLV